MKKYFQVLFIILFGMMLESCNTPREKAPATVEAVPEANELPPVTLIEETGASFSATTLEGNIILIFFGADCDHCQREAADVQNHLSGFSQYKVYFISTDEFQAIRKFAATYKLDHESNVVFLRADGKTVFNALGYINTPTICVYGANKRLKRRFDGETKVTDILPVL